MSSHIVYFLVVVGSIFRLGEFLRLSPSCISFMEMFRAACFPNSDSPIYFPTYCPLKTNTSFITSFPVCCIRLANFPLHSSVFFLSRLSLSQLFHIFPERDFPDAEFSFSVAFVFSYPLASSSRFLSRGEETPILHLSIRGKERDGRERETHGRPEEEDRERRKEKGTERVGANEI